MTALKKRVLGRTGFEVTELGFGAWPIGGEAYGPVSEKNAIETIEAYLSAGGNLIDTAPVYAKSETYIGKALKGKGIREKIFIATKTMKGDTIETIPDIKQEIDNSLRALQTDYVDIYFLHKPPDEPDVMNRAIDEFEKLKNQGKIRAIGASVKLANVTPETVRLCRQYIDTGRVDVLEVAYSILRQANAENFAYAHEKGVGIIVRTAIESGFLTGRYKPGDVFTEGHRKRWSEQTLQEILKHASELQTYAIRRPYRSLAQVALRFALVPKEVSCVIVGAENP
ncbi:MAG: aldo/keto reductase, partial [Deltaproteobacteria bacterium]|nr:aldo/keto reductase [Deltaproteobacteria bacterium]